MRGKHNKTQGQTFREMFYSYIKAMSSFASRQHQRWIQTYETESKQVAFAGSLVNCTNVVSAHQVLLLESVLWMIVFFLSSIKTHQSPLAILQAWASVAMNRALLESHPTVAANITPGFSPPSLQLHAANALMFYINSTCFLNKKHIMLVHD